MEDQNPPGNNNHNRHSPPHLHIRHHKETEPHYTQQEQNGYKGYGFSFKNMFVVASMLPLAGLLLTLCGLSLAGTLAGLAVTAPLFVLFSPVLVPAALLMGLAVTGILCSGAVGLAAVTVLSWVLHYLQMTAARTGGTKKQTHDAGSYKDKRGIKILV